MGIKKTIMYAFVLHITGHSGIVSLLLDNCGDYASADANGATPLHYAAQNNHSVSCVL